MAHLELLVGTLQELNLVCVFPILRFPSLHLGYLYGLTFCPCVLYLVPLIFLQSLSLCIGQIGTNGYCTAFIYELTAAVTVYTAQGEMISDGDLNY